MSSPAYAPRVGQCDWLAPMVRRVLAPNPSPMTYLGTNTYLLGRGAVALIDPGPDLSAHRAAILASLEPGEQITQILVTHAHLDHSPLAMPLGADLGAPVLGYGDVFAGQSRVMADLRARGDLGGGEGLDTAFVPDQCLPDMAEISFAGGPITAIWTPGHLSNHMCFAYQDMVFSGDHVMDWASSLISPPDGDLTAFMASCARLAARDDRIYYPGHGAPVENPAARIAHLITHRKSRETAILSHLESGGMNAEMLANRIYTDTDPALLPAATRNVLAHLIDLTSKNTVRPTGDITRTTVFTRVSKP